MKRYVYPAIFYNDENMVKVLFPDLDLGTEGKFMEEAYYFAKEFLKMYFVKVEKFDFDFNMPSDYRDVRAMARKEDVVMLVDATVTKKDLK